MSTKKFLNALKSLKYIADSLGQQYADPVLLNLEEMLKESTVRVPLICLLSMGSDPTNQICDLAKKMSLECRCISMGQGQEVHARRLLSLAKEQGGWVLLQNCHLGLEFMEELLEFVLFCEDPNPSMRIWITVEPHPEFSITLLQSAIKFTNEPPQGKSAGYFRKWLVQSCRCTSDYTIGHFQAQIISIFYRYFKVSVLV